MLVECGVVRQLGPPQPDISRGEPAGAPVLEPGRSFGVVVVNDVRFVVGPVEELIEHSSVVAPGGEESSWKPYLYCISSMVSSSQSWAGGTARNPRPVGDGSRGMGDWDGVA